MLELVAALPPARPLLERVGEDPSVYLVGGAVRDLLLGRQPSELDLLVDGDAAAVAKRLGGEVVIHDRFGTSTVRLHDHRYDIARSRRETYTSPGALPEVTPAPVVEDLARRDFTINALAVALAGPEAGKLLTVPSTIEDLDARLLRVIHDRSFVDDPTRLLRLVRYQTRLGFEIEPRTLALAAEAIESGALGTVSGARIGAELRLLAREPDPVAAFVGLHELCVDAAIDPCFGLVDPELARRALDLLPPDGRPGILSLALAFQNVPPDDLAELLERLSFEAGERDLVLSAATKTRSLADSLADASRPSLVAAAAAGAPPELVALAGARPETRAAASLWLDRLRDVRLEIDGRDLLEAGVAQGPAVGRGLKAALDAKLDGRVDGREAELEAALEAALGTDSGLDPD